MKVGRTCWQDALSRSPSVRELLRLRWLPAPPPGSWSHVITFPVHLEIVMGGTASGQSGLSHCAGVPKRFTGLTGGITAKRSSRWRTSLTGFQNYRNTC